jgi:hypothetical protein
MIAGVRGLVRQLLGAPATRGVSVRGILHSRRELARAALGWWAAAFVLASAGLAMTVETIRPEWRDPEYGHRIHQLQDWKARAPERPVVMVFGSSRTQMGIAPAAMRFTDAPSAPIVYNFGYRSGRLFRSCFQLLRILDDGPRPDFVLIQLSMVDLIGGVDGELLPVDWGGRLGAGDFARLAPYIDDRSGFRRAWLAARLNGWSAHRQSILSDLLPSWQLTSTRQVQYYWERLDTYGFTPHHMESPSPGYRKALYERARRVHGPAFAGAPVSAMTERAVHDVVARCREAGIDVAFFWAPESISYRSWYSEEARREMNRFEAWIRNEISAPVFPTPIDLPDTDFVDGFHMIKSGAERYSRWLADTHIRPWLAERGIRFQ